MSGVTREKPKDDDNKSRQEEFNKFHEEGRSGEEKKLLKKIREKHGFFHISFSDKELLVRRKLREMPKEERIPVMRMAAYLCESSPYSFNNIHEIFSYSKNPAKSIKNLYDTARKLMNAGVTPSTACAFAHTRNSRQIDDLVKVTQTLKETVPFHKLDDLTLSKERTAAMAEAIAKVGDEKIKLVVQNAEKNLRMSMGILGELLICMRGTNNETTEFWLDRLEDLRKTYDKKGPEAAKTLVKSLGNLEQSSGTTHQSKQQGG